MMAAIDGFDYVVMADSGPAHMSKLAAVPGLVALFGVAYGIRRKKRTN